MVIKKEPEGTTWVAEQTAECLAGRIRTLCPRLSEVVLRWVKRKGEVPASWHLYAYKRDKDGALLGIKVGLLPDVLPEALTNARALAQCITLAFETYEKEKMEVMV